jgi:hypothetical protein
MGESGEAEGWPPPVRSGGLLGPRAEAGERRRRGRVGCETNSCGLQTPQQGRGKEMRGRERNGERREGRTGETGGRERGLADCAERK